MSTAKRFPKVSPKTSAREPVPTPRNSGAVAPAITSQFPRFPSVPIGSGNHAVAVSSSRVPDPLRGRNRGTANRASAGLECSAPRAHARFPGIVNAAVETRGRWYDTNRSAIPIATNAAANHSSLVGIDVTRQIHPAAPTEFGIRGTVRRFTRST